MGIETAIILATAAAATAGGVSAYQQGQAADAQAKSQQAWAEYNAQIEENNAKTAEATSRYEQRQKRKEDAMLRGSQRVAYAKSGLSLSEGTPLEVMENTAAEQELDILMLKRNADIQAAGHRSAAGGYRMQGDMARRQGKAAKTASYWNMGSSILSGTSEALSLKHKYGRINT